MSTAATYVVIGVSAAGCAALQKLRQLDATATIICLSQEAEPPYNKCFLADYVSDTKTVSEVYTKSQDFFIQNNILLYSETEVLSIDRAEKKIFCTQERSFSYTKLLLAVGASPRLLPLFATDFENVLSFYTLNDAQLLKEKIVREKHEHVVVIGGGLTGLEVADALSVHNVSVTLIEAGARMLGRQADEHASETIVRAAAARGVTCKVGVQVTGCDQSKKEESARPFVTALTLSDGTQLPTTLVVVALGSVANLALPEKAGLEIACGGVLTNDFLQTSDPAIFAAGDVAVVHAMFTKQQVRTATWPDAVQQGMYAAYGMAGQPRLYPGIVRAAASHFFGLSFYSAGALEAADPSWSVVIVEQDEFSYEKVIFNSEHVVQGFLCVGTPTPRLLAYKRSLLTHSKFAFV